jgi:two-component system phosphate regulon sensor histidine kinase PhoR
MFPRLLIAFIAVGAVSSYLVVALSPARLEPTDIGLIALGIGAVAACFAWLVARLVRQPIRDAQVAAERLSRGEPSERVHGGPLPEGRELAGAINEMSDRLVGQIKRLEAERQQLRAALGGMVEGVVAVGAGQRILLANAAAGRMLDFDPAAVAGRPLYEVSRQPALQAVIDRAIRSRQPEREELEVAWSAGRHLSVYVAPLPADAAGVVLVLHDTSEVRRLERLRQDFVANVSHELKTPLAVVQACAEALLDGAADDPTARTPFLQQIADQSGRLHSLILDLISLARIESGDVGLNLDAIPVGEAVAACLDRHRPRADAKRMTLESVNPPGSLAVWADDEALGQILDNLVDNAIKYTQEGGTVRVRWESTSNGVCLTVEDNGPGIPERDLPRVFERFYRVDRARSRELGGTGLGLAIVKHLAAAMGGSVKAASELGRGSSFTVSLPRPV